MSGAPRIGVLGGTLDPIHLGHLDTALAARAALSLDRVLVVPARVPPHRPVQPIASPHHRFAMAALAVHGCDGLVVSDLELSLPEGPSYTAETLERLQASLSAASTQIFFITGADAFAEIETWHRYPEVLDLAHFVVVARPGFALDTLPRRLPRLAPRMTAATAAGADRGEPAIFLLDAPTHDVSSTEVRRRLAAGLPVTGLLPSLVETHILQHGLYAAPPRAAAANHLHGEN
jgi:nicotinate-nucleotide adenylyltransferase